MLEMVEVVEMTRPRLQPDRGEVLQRLKAGEITADQAVAELEGG